MIKVTDLSAGYGSKEILRSLNVAAQPGQFIALLGPNGSGKSTFIKSLCGLIKPQAGHITIDGDNIWQMKPRQRAKAAAYLAQSREAAPMMKVGDIVSLGRAPYRGVLGKLSAQGEAKVETAIARARIEDFTERRYDHLSGGEQARVQLARALAVDAPLLLLDEPIAALDPFYQITMMEILKEEAASGKTVIAALHDIGLAHQFADRVWIMHEGKLAADNVPSELDTDKIYGDVFGIKPPEGGFKSLTLK